MKKKFYPDFQVVRTMSIVIIVSSLKMNNRLKGKCAYIIMAICIATEICNSTIHIIRLLKHYASNYILALKIWQTHATNININYKSTLQNNNLKFNIKVHIAMCIVSYMHSYIHITAWM